MAPGRDLAKVTRAVRTSMSAGHGIYWRVVGGQHHLRVCRSLESAVTFAVSVNSFKESDCKVTDCGSRVQRVLAKIDGKVEKGTVTLDEEKGEISYVVEGHASPVCSAAVCQNRWLKQAVSQGHSVPVSSLPCPLSRGFSVTDDAVCSSSSFPTRRIPSSTK